MKKNIVYSEKAQQSIRTYSQGIQLLMLKGLQSHLSAAVVLVLGAVSLFGADLDEWKVKREQIFEFTQKPVVTRNGDLVTIKFETKAFCDAAVAVEDMNGKILCHVGSGVLGSKAPEPFQKNH